jgi:hypothetical protein
MSLTPQLLITDSESDDSDVNVQSQAARGCIAHSKVAKCGKMLPVAAAALALAALAWSSQRVSSPAEVPAMDVIETFAVNCTESPDPDVCEGEARVQNCSSEVNATISDCCAKEPEPLQAKMEICELSCAKAGEDCSGVQCCDDPMSKCYVKNEHWAGCKRDCVAGENDTTEPIEHQSPWDCTQLSTHDPVDCTVEGEDCIMSRCCFNGSKRCLEKDAFYAACILPSECTPNETYYKDVDPWKNPWTCRDLTEGGAGGLRCGKFVFAMIGILALWASES